MGDGDGWIRCARGHRHWGRYGAAGLLLRDGAGRWVLQHRAEWTHEGGTWGIPGGARDSHESAIATALREAHEEAAIEAAAVRPTGLLIDDHGGWSYTTVVADVAGKVDPHAANSESTEITWCSREQVQSLPLHSGFSTTWPRLRDCGPGVVLVVDIDDWMHHHSAGRGDSACDQLVSLLHCLHTVGVETAELPSPTAITDRSPLSRHFPQLMLVSRDASTGHTITARAAEQAIPVLTAETGPEQGDHVMQPGLQWLTEIHIRHTAAPGTLQS
jgi:8-oxo-dGTP pyrophosphatase MutT (NUDIX family)